MGSPDISCSAGKAASWLTFPETLSSRIGWSRIFHPFRTSFPARLLLNTSLPGKESKPHSSASICPGSQKRNENVRQSVRIQSRARLTKCKTPSVSPQTCPISASFLLDCQRTVSKTTSPRPPQYPAAMEQSPALITVGELAKILKVSTRTVWRLVSAGKLMPPIRVGGARRWKFDQVRRWIDAGCPVGSWTDV